jgi:hypothetical protein
MAYGVGIGKPRTRLGKFLDSYRINQIWLENKTGISNPTMTSLCNDKGYRPTERTKMKVITVLQNEVDPHIGIADFW